MLHLEPIPAFEDNYIWAVHDGQSAVFVDPGEAAPILAWLAALRLRPAALLVTHHHGDHTGGILELLSRHPGLPVHASARDRIAGVTHPVGDGQHCDIPELGLDFQVLAIPGHTQGHVGYFGHGWLFCGDTLFSCGCGKVFEGHPETLHASLTRLAGLPGETLVCCAHEYTLDNIRFARSLDPDNPALAAWQGQASSLRRSGLPTLPTRLADELACNPFLRCQDPALRQRLADLAGVDGFPSDAAAFIALRRLKDAFA